jgi:alkylated DNA repair dioxygenase AlkB
MSAQQNLFADHANLAPGRPDPDGFSYHPEVLSPADERDLARDFAALPFTPFEFHGFHGKRRIASFGWRYDYAGRALRPSEAVPDFLLALRDRAAAIATLSAASLQQVLVTEYAPGAGIGWHRDKPMFDQVVALSFVSPCRLRLRQRRGDGPGAGWRRLSIDVAPRSAYVLQGAARREWEHSIPPVEALRYSVTFRNFVAGKSHEPAHG